MEEKASFQLPLPVNISVYGLSNPLPSHFGTSAQADVKGQPSLTLSVNASPLPPIVMPDEKTLRSEEPNPLRCDPNDEFSKSLYGVDRIPSGVIRFGRTLGAGAFGQVYQGLWGKHHVALKVIDVAQAQKKLYGAFEEHNAPTLEQLSEALQWEVLSLSSVSHPNLVTFYGIYQHQSEGATYLVMEYCAGGTLQNILKHPVPWSKRWQWALEMTQGLAAIHEQGLLHRDLKAENVLLDYRYCAKLGDLGVAQMDALLQASEAEVVAKGLHDNRFIAPENYHNPTLSNPATDIYALGLVFWQMMTGKEPRRLDEFSPQEGQAWLAGRDREIIPENTPEEKAFAKLIRGCWQKDPQKRPSAADLCQSLKEIGKDFHPKAEWVMLAETIELQLHSKRKAGQSYQSSFATQYALTETADSYWQDREKADYEPEKDQNPPLPLGKVGDQFLQTPASHLLLLGEAGLGKTLTTYQWADQQLERCWAWCDSPLAGEMPAWPLLLRHWLLVWSHQHLQQVFPKLLKKLSASKDNRWLVILDGYDELLQDLPDDLSQTLADKLGLPPGEHSLLISCRPQTLTEVVWRSRLAGGQATQLFHLLPFSHRQLLDYLQPQLGWTAEKKEAYADQLKAAEQLRAVLRNPLVLYLLAQSWETVIAQYDLPKLTRWQIYEGFIAHTVIHHAGLLSPTLQKQLCGEHKDLLSSYKAFFSEVAAAAFHVGEIRLSEDLAVEKIHSRWFSFEALLDHDSRKRFHTRTVALDWQEDLHQKPGLSH